MNIVYFSHSYRADDSKVVSYFGKLLEESEIIPSLDPPSNSVNAAKLERHMLSTDGMIAVLTKRSDGYSQHIMYEIYMCLRARKPLLVFIEDTLPDAIIPSRVLQRRFSRTSFLRQHRNYEHAIEQLKRYVGERPPPQYSISMNRRACGLIGLSALKRPIQRVVRTAVEEFGYAAVEIDSEELTSLRERKYTEALLPVSLGINFIDVETPVARYLSGLMDGFFIPTIQITANASYPFAHMVPLEYQPQIVNTAQERPILEYIRKAITLAEQDFLELENQQAVEKYASMLFSKIGRAGEYGTKIRDVIVGEVVMRDKIEVNAPVVGPVGPGARAGNISGTQSWMQIRDQIDLTVLASELAKLKAALQTSAKSDDEVVEAEMVDLAEQSARAGNGAKAFGFLQKAGKWTLSTATKIGLTVAAGVITSALGS